MALYLKRHHNNFKSLYNVMALERDRFVGKINEEFICSICQNVFRNPIQTPCEHIFCKECINTWLSKETRCPLDQRRLKLNDLKPVPRVFRSLLNDLKIRCSHSSHGCEKVVNLEELERHLKECEYNPEKEIQCTSCGAIYGRNESHNCVSYLLTLISIKEDEMNILRSKYLQSSTEIDRGISVIRQPKVKPKCGLTWPKNFTFYRCRTCAKSKDMALCLECFQRGNHKGHQYEIETSYSSGYCDCGDNFYMNTSGFCPKHG